MKLCRYSGSQHPVEPCSMCWPMLRYPQPLSPGDAKHAATDLAWEPKWRGYALVLAGQMREHWNRIARTAHPHARLPDWEANYWHGVWCALHVIIGRDESERGRRRRTRAA